MAFFRFWVRKIYGQENLPQQGPAIIVSNHTSYYDWIVMSLLYGEKYIVFLANRDLLNRPVVRWLIKLHIIVYVDTQKPGFSYFKEVLRLLKQRYVVVIYPEGTRSRTGKMIWPKPGFVKLAMHAGAPVFPFGIRGAYEILPPHRRLPRFKKCDLVCGKAVHINAENPLFRDIFDVEMQRSHHLSDDACEEIALRIMDIVGELAQQPWSETIVESRKDLGYSQTIRSRTVAVFDFDDVLFQGQSQKALLNFLYQKGKISHIHFYSLALWFVLYKLRIVKDPMFVRKRALRLFRGWKVTATKELFQEFYKYVIRPKFSSRVLSLIHKHHWSGRTIVLASASLELILNEVCLDLGIDHYVATRLESVAGRYTGAISGEVPYGESKVHVLRSLFSQKGLTWKGSFAYTDHISDLPLLEAVENPCVVAPDPLLKEEAKNRGWRRYAV